MVIPVVIPAYEPDEKLLSLLRELKSAALCPIVVVNDGSGSRYNTIFLSAGDILGKNGTILTHEVNRGKGAALKTAFQYVLRTWPDAVGVVTADSDGQHTPACIEKVKEALIAHPDDLVMGVRTFDSENIPWKSRFGNTLTIKVFRLATGLSVSDTQTGLRGIPARFMRELLQIRGDRFEFEMEMLLESVGKYPVFEVPIETVYDSKENHQTHFNPVKDSVRIYRLLLGKFFRYILSSLSSSIVDLAAFELFCLLTRGHLAAYIALSTVLARIISATYNYLMNYKVVFKSREKMGRSALKYFTLAVIQMSLSALLVTGGVWLLPVLPEVVVKMIVDTCLFFVSYYVQKRFVF